MQTQNHVWKVLFIACFLVFPALVEKPASAENANKPRSIPEDIWPSDETPILKVVPHFNEPAQVKYRLTLAGEWKTHTPLAYAFAQGDRAMARVLLKRGAEPNEVLPAGKLKPVSPMQAAIASNDPEAVRFLLAVGAKAGLSHLTDTASIRDSAAQLEMTRLILDSGVPTPGEAIVYQYAQQCSTEAFALLFEHGAKVTNTVTPLKLEPTLYAAIVDVEKVRIALKHGADANANRNGGDTPLHACAHRGTAATVDLLVAHGAKVNVRNSNGEFPIDRALVRTSFWSFRQNGDLALVKTLLRHGATSSMAAEVATGNVEALKMRLEAGEPIAGLPPLDEDRTWYGVNEGRRDLVAMAASFGQAETLNWLLQNGFRETTLRLPDMKIDRMDAPALVIAAYQCNLKCVETLLKHGANPNVLSPKGVYVDSAFTPLHAALFGASGTGWFWFETPEKKKVKLSNEQRQTIRLLVEHGADPDLKNGYGKTSREFAAKTFPGEALFPSDR
jgi:ankyrin repeat protein